VLENKRTGPFTVEYDLCLTWREVPALVDYYTKKDSFRPKKEKGKWYLLELGFP
jgi:hypothetical protein